ncbi:MAG: hypothetical protein FWF00_06570 [Endomicrobia bacterium]|nr:hypothetical protein [Endomicrobiia bacterium]MCL2507327.1 hypothetical protein [Endomicrobiia bacterium]
MKKVLLAVIAVFLLSPCVYATKFVSIIKNEGTVQIKTPDGELITYKSGDKIPELLYGSKIIAGSKPVSIQFFRTAVIVLEKNQGIFFTKNPISKRIEIFKLETKSTHPNIKLLLPENITAQFGGDTKIALKEQFPTIYLEVKTGLVTVKEPEGAVYRLQCGDDYEAKQSLRSLLKNDF